MRSSIYDSWVWRHENPDEIIERGAAPKQSTPTWIEKMRGWQKLREEMGEDKYFEMEQEWEERKRRLNKEYDEGI